MRRRTVDRRKRAELAWMLAGLVGVQLALAVGVECFWPSARDPEFDFILHRLQERIAESPDRPLVLALGSSRTQMGLRGDQLSRLSGAGAPLVFNFAVPTSGPMLQQVALRRLLAAGVRPDVVILEVMPMSLSRRGGSPLEERQLDPARLTAAEVACLYRYYNQPYKLLSRWAAARLLPAYRHQAELRQPLGLDASASARAPCSPVDGHGWRAQMDCPGPGERESRIRFALGQYEAALADPVLAERPHRALNDLLALCRHQRLPAALVIPPEATSFRTASGAGHTPLDDCIREVAAAHCVPLFDARAWVDDDGFWDGHHMWIKGADQYTERFGREVLGPMLERHMQPEMAARGRGALTARTAP
jgi:hypothetical protein